MSAKPTPKQVDFVSQYLVDGNATRAAIAVGYSEKSAAVTGAKLLKNPAIARLVRVRKEKQAERLELTADLVLEPLKAVATFDAGRLYDEAGNRIPVHLLDARTRAAVVGVEDETRGVGKKRVRVQRVKIADKIRAAELLGKHLNLWGNSEFSAAVQTGAGGMPADTSITVKLVRPDAA